MSIEKTPSSETLQALLLSVRSIAKLLGCSIRTVYRLADGGKMPLPVRIGGLVRWRAEDIAQWVADGCLSLGKAGAR